MTQLHVIAPEPLGQSVIDRLEEALEKARAGQISSIGLAVVYRDGSTSRSWSGAPSMSLLIGAVARLHHALLSRAESD